GTEAAHRLLVFIHPRLELLVRKEPRLRQRRLFLPQAPGDEQQQFRPFCRRQLLGGAFDFGQRFHEVILPSGAQVGNRTLADQWPSQAPPTTRWKAVRRAGLRCNRGAWESHRTAVSTHSPPFSYRNSSQPPMIPFEP